MAKAPTSASDEALRSACWDAAVPLEVVLSKDEVGSLEAPKPLFVLAPWYWVRISFHALTSPLALCSLGSAVSWPAQLRYNEKREVNREQLIIIIRARVSQGI